MTNDEQAEKLEALFERIRSEMTILQNVFVEASKVGVSARVGQLLTDGAYALGRLTKLIDEFQPVSQLESGEQAVPAPPDAELASTAEMNEWIELYRRTMEVQRCFRPVPRAWQALIDRRFPWLNTTTPPSPPSPTR